MKSLPTINVGTSARNEAIFFIVEIAALSFAKTKDMLIFGFFGRRNLKIYYRSLIISNNFARIVLLFFARVFLCEFGQINRF
jgi:hypothetical protein